MIHSLRQFAKQILQPKEAGQEKYITFKKLLNNDQHCHELLAELEELYYQKKNIDVQVVGRVFRELSTAVAALVRDLHQLMPDRYNILDDYHKKFDFYCRFALAPP
ncbi:MAG: hypothetical protein PF442_11790 [Desulfobulbaceae bacterium]|jgi:pyruvate,water dikinase|nr:hypothetical protein [Desulfobulbaceae bacterium]